VNEFIFTLCLVCSAPGIVAGIALLALEHAVMVRNPFKILWHFLRASVWVVPVIAGTFLALIVIAFLPAARPYGAIFLGLLNGAAFVVICRRADRPKHLNESFFHLTPVLALGLAAWIVADSSLFRSLSHASP
jgi:hypothetical protein